MSKTIPCVQPCAECGDERCYKMGNHQGILPKPCDGKGSIALLTLGGGEEKLAMVAEVLAKFDRPVSYYVR